MSGQPKSTFARRVRTARPRDKRLEVRDDAVQGLILRVFLGGERTFALEGLVPSYAIKNRALLILSS